ncbi:MAG TPA: hypothetical protein PKN33_20590 [Phycisphaerae bacterium]|nr:hypothetical protein [Phycisphaerae bacterium]
MKKPYTDAGKAFMEALTNWLQDTRLISEGVSRLFSDYQRDGRIDFSDISWPKPKKPNEMPDAKRFDIKAVQLSHRMEGLLKEVWSSRFVFLETLWEEYLQDLMIEIRHHDASVFEPFCEKDFMCGLIRDVLTDQVGSIEDIKEEAAARFAAGLTRQAWNQQWKQLTRLNIGLRDSDKDEPWYPKLDEYFEIRNCIIHAQGRVSAQLKGKNTYYADRDTIEIWPNQLDYYRHQFIACLLYIEGKFRAKFASP